MDFFESDSQRSLLITLFKHNGLKIKIFNSTKDAYIDIGYETKLITYHFKTVAEASSFGNYLIKEYLDARPSIEDFLDRL